ncbi:glycosyl hydrolase family 88 [Paenibacillus antri]|uniref:Glycosyl hydrolase family 88 n=1 Tax=Paenibacillus antri TaxID=2582848 RepID=A0A5R9G9U8_9BACL|nr:glycoside hydrolase family 88 protein [Paenibacillus antri]TLS51879.1 glycosyl hydrolase family 88 [Paenibacillus antri]
MIDVSKQVDMTPFLRKIERNMERFDRRIFPGTAKDGKYSDSTQSFLEMYHWTNSFFTGMVFYAHELTKDKKYLKYLQGYEPLYRAKVFEKPLETMHDLGFLYSLYSVAMYKTTGDLRARETALKAADELAKRFNVRGNYIQAWGKMSRSEGNFCGWMIADCMMNLPLLYWAWKETGHTFYRDVANEHAKTNSKYIVREDRTVAHAYAFDPDSGEPLGERNDCGAAVGSYWARGTSWQIYGYALAYRYTGQPDFLETAERVADRYLEELGNAGVPIWDFRLPEGTPDDPDPTASVVVACGLLELARHVGAKGERYRSAAERMVSAVSQPEFCSWDETYESIVIVRQQDGTVRSGIWGDYFFLEATLRLRGAPQIYW